MSQFEVEVPPFVGNANMNTRQEPLYAFFVVATFNLARHGAIEPFDAYQFARQEQRIHPGAALVVHQKYLQAEVEAADVTHADSFRHRDGFQDAEAQPQSTRAVPLDTHGLDFTTHRAMLHELVRLVV